MSRAPGPRYQAARAWLADRPDFETRSPAEQAAARFPLERPAALLEALGRPDRRFRIFLVAGTKGKGSTASFLASVLRAHGLRVGLYSQPHLHSYRERLRLDGEPIAPEQFANQVERLRPIVEDLDRARPALGRLTAYEVTTALGLSWFAQEQVDWAVLEVGLGGRLDATNVVEPTVAVITSISYDHTQILGRTLPLIAAEKAGIVKPEARVVSAPQRPSALATIRRASRAQHAHLTVVGAGPAALHATRVDALRFPAETGPPPGAPLITFDAASGRRRYVNLGLGLGGQHQVTNALTALAALEAAEGAGQLHLDPDAIRAGLLGTRWPGRFELVGRAPLVVLDGAHNGDSAARLLDALRLHVEFDRLHLALGVLADKDLRAILRPFVGAVRRLVAVRPASSRARPAEDVARAARRLGIEAEAAASVAAGLEQARARAADRDVVCVTGSLSVVAEAREALGLAGCAARLVEGRPDTP